MFQRNQAFRVLPLFLFFFCAVPALAQTPDAYTLPPEKYQKAIEYSLTRYKLHFFNAGLTFALLAAFIGLKLAPRLREHAEKITRWRLAQAFIVTAPLMLLLDLLMLPTAVYAKSRAMFYGVSVQSWGAWGLDWAKGEALSIAVTVPLIWLLYLVLRRWSRRAWLVFWLASLPLVAAVVFVMPVVVDPLFDKFTPLADTQPALVAEIEKVTRRGGLDIPRERIFEMEASGKTRALNAYVTGLGATKRVVVWDTTAREMTPDQTLFVFGHEMGHYVLNHVFKGLALGCLGSLALFWLAFHLSRRLVARYGKRLGVNGLDDWAALPLILLVAAVLSFAGEPVANAFSRHLEHEADVYALEITRGVIPDNQKAGAEAFQILGEKSLAHPNPPAFVKFWLFSHPPIAERLKFAREYVP